MRANSHDRQVGLWNLAEYDAGTAVAVRRLRAYVADSQLGAAPVIARRPPTELQRVLGLRAWIEGGGMDADSFDAFLRRYLAEGTRLHHPGYLSHQCASPDLPSALADLVHGVTNNAMSLYEMGAAAATVELTVVEWMLSKIGWHTPQSAGVLVDGGSLANLTALLAARAHALPDAWYSGNSAKDTVLLAPPGRHVSIDRAAAIMGLGARSVVDLPADDLGRIRTEDVAEVIDSQRAADRTILALVANACAPPTGLYDDLAALSCLCREQGVWFHVDSAHGASALLVPELRSLLKGIEQADSVVWDAHKMLRTSTLAAAVLVRHAATLDGAFNQEADYLFFDDDRAGPDLMKRTVEGAKSELGLKLFLNLAWRGEKGMACYVASRHAVARRLWQLANTADGFETPFAPQSNVVCLRYRPNPDVEPPDQALVRDCLIADGDFHLASSVVRGTRWLRATVMAPATTETDLHRLLDAIRNATRLCS